MFPWDDGSVEKIKKEYALSQLRERRQAAHAMFYSDCEKDLFDRIPMRHNILMVMRFDGNIGFPGGFVDIKDQGETVESGLNRELMEEVNLDPKYKVTEDNYLASYVHHTKNGTFLNHFYVKKVSEDDFKVIERGAFDAIEWGKETLGIVNVPVQKGVGIRRTYLPIVDFLQNKFIGNARQELIEGILKAGIFTESEMEGFWREMVEQQEQ